VDKPEREPFQWKGYLLAFTFTAVALLLRIATAPRSTGRSPYSIFYLSVALAGAFGGWGPGVFALIIGAIAGSYHLTGPGAYRPLPAFLIISGLLMTLTAGQRRAKLAAQRALAMADERGRQLEAEIQQRRLAEESERLQRQWLEVTLASIGDGVIAADTEGRIAFLNQTAATLTGWRREDALGQAIDSVFVIRNEETGEPVENPVDRAIREGVVTGLANHTILLARDGSRIPIDDSGAPIIGSDGRILGAVLIFRDVTEARAQSAALVARDRMIDFAHDAIIMMGADRRISFWNSGAEELYGFTAAEASDQVTHDLLHTRGSLSPVEVDEILRVNSRWEGELTHTCKDGHTVVVESRQVRIPGIEGQPDGILEVNRDITERKRAAATAEEGKRTLDALLAHVPEGIAIADATGRVRAISRVGLDLAGAADAGSVTFRLRSGEGVAAQESLPLARALAGEIVTVEEWSMELPGGGTIPILCGAAPIRDSAGRIDGALFVWRDISQRKEMEEKLRETAKLESLGVLAGGIAHDFNNLLTGVLGNATLLQDMVAADAAAVRCARSIATSAEHASRLTQQMLAYSGRGRFVIEPIDLSAYIGELVPLLQASISKSVELRFQLDGNLPLVEADSAQLQQLVMNLIVNAAEACAPDRGTVDIKTCVQEIDAAYLQSMRADDGVGPGRFVMLEVKDSGRGMDAATQARIFEPFFTTKFTGRGLGLAAVQGIVRGHRGMIRVTSAPGAGATFRVLMPASAKTQPDSKRPVDVSPVPAASGGILLVDDEETVRSVARTALERLGYRVTLAASGKEAVERLQEEGAGIRLMILDMTMPGMSPEEIITRVRALSPELPVLLSSGFSESEALQRFAGQNLAGFLQKPYTVGMLRDKIRDALRQ
jgi:two-component system cell cycle sensor histidine kinase/response regulator CckA